MILQYIFNIILYFYIYYYYNIKYYIYVFKVSIYTIQTINNLKELAALSSESFEVAPNRVLLSSLGV